jgi:hypothetical protein
MILISGKITFKKRNIVRDITRHIMMIKEPNNDSVHTQQPTIHETKTDGIKRLKRQSIILARYFNTHFNN